MSIQTLIVGSGSYLPNRIIKNEDFLQSTFFDDNGQAFTKPNAEIIEKFQNITEIKERRYIEEHQLNSDIATIAAQRALEDAQIDPETLDMIFVAHNFGDVVGKYRQIDICPSLSVRVKHNLKIKNRHCKPYDMLYGCPGWIESMILANQLIKGGVIKRALVIGSETLSKITDPHDRNAMIFADGAAACVVQGHEDTTAGILTYDSLSDVVDEWQYINGSKSLNSQYEGNEVNIRMKGRKVYEYVLKYVPQAIQSVIDSAGLHLSDISRILMHQANAKMDYAILDRLYELYGMYKVERDLMPMTIQYLGNSSVATVPTMFDLIKKGELAPLTFQKDQYIVMASVGAGMNINAMVYKF